MWMAEDGNPAMRPSADPDVIMIIDDRNGTERVVMADIWVDNRWVSLPSEEAPVFKQWV